MQKAADQDKILFRRFFYYLFRIAIQKYVHIIYKCGICLPSPSVYDVTTEDKTSIQHHF